MCLKQAMCDQMQLSKTVPNYVPKSTTSYERQLTIVSEIQEEGRVCNLPTTVCGGEWDITDNSCPVTSYITSIQAETKELHEFKCRCHISI